MAQEDDKIVDPPADDKVVTPPAVDDKTVSDPPKVPETVPYSRFQEVIKAKNDLTARLDKIEADKKTADQAQLEDEGKHKDLNTQLKTEIDDLQKKIVNQGLKSIVRAQIASSVDIADPKKREININGIESLLDFSSITLTDGSASGVNEAIKTVEQSYPELFKIGETLPPDPKKVSNISPGNPNFEAIAAADVSKMDAKQLAEYEKHLTGVDPTQHLY